MVTDNMPCRFGGGPVSIRQGMILLLGLFSIVAEATTSSIEPLDLSLSNRFCFPPAERRQSSWRATAIKLEIAAWQSHRIITRMAEILLREKMGYRVFVQGFIDDETISYSQRAYERITEGTVDVNMEMWPESLPHAIRTTTLEQALVSARDLGPLGYAATSGWFIPIASLREAAATPWAAQLGGTALWRTLVPLFHMDGVQGVLANHSRLPPPNISADEMLARRRPEETLLPSAIASAQARDDPEMTHGTYACAAWGCGWSTPSADCCTRAEAEVGACAGRRACAILSVASPAYDSGQNEMAIVGSGLRLEIEYGADRHALVARAASEALPVLVHAWEPDPNLIRAGMPSPQISHPPAAFHDLLSHMCALPISSDQASSSEFS